VRDGVAMEPVPGTAGGYNNGSGTQNLTSPMGVQFLHYG